MVRKISFTFFKIHIDNVLSHGLTGSNPFLHESQDNLTFTVSPNILPS